MTSKDCSLIFVDLKISKKTEPLTGPFMRALRHLPEHSAKTSSTSKESIKCSLKASSTATWPKILKSGVKVIFIPVFVEVQISLTEPTGMPLSKLN